MNALLRRYFTEIFLVGCSVVIEMYAAQNELVVLRTLKIYINWSARHFKTVLDANCASFSSLSFDLFVVSFMQEDVYIGHTALALTLGLQVFC